VFEGKVFEGKAFEGNVFEGMRDSSVYLFVVGKGAEKWRKNHRKRTVLGGG
jgi:hypothetical protein